MNEMIQFFEAIREAEKIRSIMLQHTNLNPTEEESEEKSTNNIEICTPLRN